MNALREVIALLFLDLLGQLLILDCSFPSSFCCLQFSLAVAFKVHSLDSLKRHRHLAQICVDFMDVVAHLSANVRHCAESELFRREMQGCSSGQDPKLLHL